jgi:Tfp pilus assembly PilM family ATPase
MMDAIDSNVWLRRFPVGGLMRDRVLSKVRRYAAGIDVGIDQVRVCVLSKSSFGESPVRLEFHGSASLRSGAVMGPDWVDAQAVATALSEVFSAGRGAALKRGLRCAMGLPSDATVVGDAALAELMPRGTGNSQSWQSGDSLDLLEPGVLAEAERLSGLERNSLAVDWFMASETVRLPPRVTIVATPRQHLDTRVEAAARAGLMLVALDGEPAAALRACRCAAAIELTADENYVVLWIGAEGMIGWRLGRSDNGGMIRVLRVVRYPAVSRRPLLDTLRELGAEACHTCALLAGDLTFLETAGVSLLQLAAALRCVILPFDLGSFPAAPRSNLESGDSAAFAVPFGLALRQLQP